MVHLQIQDLGEADLKNFNRHAFITYTHKFLKKGKQNIIKKLYYPGKDEKSELSLVLFSPYSMPELKGLNIKGNVKKLPNLLKMLRGYLTAEFSNVNLNDLSELFRMRIKGGRQDGWSQTGNIGVYFSRNPEKQNEIKRLMVEEQEGFRKDHAPVPLEETYLGEATKNLLHSAERISVKNSFYPRNNSNRELVHESCDVFQIKKGNYLMDYCISSANGNRLSSDLFPRLNDLFELVKYQFDETSFKKMKIKDPEQKRVSGVDMHV